MQFIKTKFHLNENEKTVYVDIFNNGVFIHTLTFSYKIEPFNEPNEDGTYDDHAICKEIGKADELFLIYESDDELLREKTFDWLLITKAVAFVEHELKIWEKNEKRQKNQN